MDARMAGLAPTTNAIFKPFIVMAAKFLGPGRLRLEMVKLAHDLNDKDRSVRDRPAIQPDQRAG